MLPLPADVRAFERLFRDNYGSLCRFATRFVDDPSRAEELVQSVFTTLWVNRATWAVEHSERAYLFAAVRNAALNDRKHARVRREWEAAEARAEVADQRTDPSQPDELMEREETAQRVRGAIAALPERCRMVMDLRWRDQMSYAEIAEAMGISVKGVESQLARGLQRLRAILGSRFDE